MDFNRLCDALEPYGVTVTDDVFAAVLQMLAEARIEVKDAVEEWFTNVSLDDLFSVKGWKS